jgi:hypothetical protein
MALHQQVRLFATWRGKLNVNNMISLPAPKDRLAGCIWLPRILAKARLLQRGELPPAYAERFCHPTGVDSVFLNHFHLNREDILAAAGKTDKEVTRWFRLRAEGGAENVAKWNETAVNLGRPGYPMAERFSIARDTVYKNVNSTGMTTVFELLEADDTLT